MRTQLKGVYGVAMVALIFGGWQVCADDKPTSLADARNAVEANLRTP